MRDIPADEPITLTKKEEARARILRGETVTNPFGEKLKIDHRSLAHLAKKGRRQIELDNRLRSLDAARATVENPHEIWEDPNTGRRKYVRITNDPSGRRVIHAVDESRDMVLSWHTNTTSFDHYRNGTLLWIRQ